MVAAASTGPSAPTTVSGAAASSASSSSSLSSSAAVVPVASPVAPLAPVPSAPTEPVVASGATGPRRAHRRGGRPGIAPADVLTVLGEHVLVDGFDLVLDLAVSTGSTLVDARTGTRYLDLYSFFASAPLGINPPELYADPAFLAELGRTAVNKPANPDVATVAYAEFVATFTAVLGDPRLPYLFFVEGGALAVENALKCAFDWKSRHNEAAGRSAELGRKVLHLRHAFHGRSGYTLSMTNTDPVKTARFPLFDWPRIDSPAQRFPVTPASVAQVRAAEARALAQAAAAFERYPHDIACFLAEPIQCEGGDRHLRPEFLAAMAELCRRHDALFVLDEVQTGVGATGSAWAYQQLGLAPDIVAFGKKVQVGGVMAGGRVDEVPRNVFRVPGRISSTWGGGLVDMVRSRRMLEVMAERRLFDAAAVLGAELLAGLVALAERYPRLASNARGRGLLCALDLPDRTTRDEALRRLRHDEHVLALPAGDVTVRFRPALTITAEELAAALAALGRVLGGLSAHGATTPGAPAPATAVHATAVHATTAHATTAHATTAHAGTARGTLAPSTTSDSPTESDTDSDTETDTETGQPEGGSAMTLVRPRRITAMIAEPAPAPGERGPAAAPAAGGSRPVGDQRAGEPGTVIASRNPALLTDVVAEVELAGPATLLAAARTARAAQRRWADVPAPVRGTVIGNLGRLVEDNAEALARLVTREIGKPLAEARGEVQEIVDTCRFFLGEGRRLYGETVPSEMPDKQLFTFRDPVGVLMVITAGNFPVAVPSWYLVPALLCGNAVVWKPAEYAAACARAVAELALRAGLPAGVLAMVPADGAATAAGLELALGAGVVDKVGFTGSTAVGRSIGALCGRHLQTPCLELGGKNPMVVAPDADLDLAVDGALFGGFGTAGQRCTSLGTLVVHTDVHAEFRRRLEAAVAAAPIGDPLCDVLYGPLLDARYAGTFEAHLGQVRDHHTVFGSTALGRIGPDAPRRGFVGDPTDGLYYHPVVVDGVRPDDELFREETFGPIVGMTTYRTLDEAIELANAPGYGLSAAIYTADPATVFRFRRGVSAGMLSVNNSTSGAEAHLPFGGNGRSGNGSRQSGRWVLDQVTRWQSVNWDYSGRLQKAQLDTAVPPADLGYRLEP